MRPDLLISCFLSFFFFYYYYLGSGLKHSRCDANPGISDSEYINGGSIKSFSAFTRNGKESLYSHKLHCATGSCLYGCFNWLHCRLSNHHLRILDNIWMYRFQCLSSEFLCSPTLTLYFINTVFSAFRYVP